MTFQELGLNEPILRALADQGYEQPSPIQAKAIPPALTGRDVLGCAQTGTGKTCAFAAPILQQLSGRKAQGRRYPRPDPHPHPGAGPPDPGEL
ncbi:MAG: DEAD/DEAH box helicase [Flavonifractor plautii]